MRRICIGDIHGNYKALKQVLERCEFDFDKDQLIQLGDIVDRWPESFECVELLLKCNNLIAIRGNHDQWFNEYINLGTVANLYQWLPQGGQSTYDSYQEHLDDKNIWKHKKFFRNQHDYYVDDDNNLFVHGGYTSLRGAQGEFTKSYLYWDRSLFEMAMSAKRHYDNGSSSMPKLLRIYNEIFIGHTSTTFWKTDKPINACNIWNLDTGCGGGGKLTAMNVDTKEYWQSDLADSFYN